MAKARREQRTVLEIGFREGPQVVGLVQPLKRGDRYIGIDIRPEVRSLLQAKKKAKELGLIPPGVKVNFLKADGLSLPFKDNSIHEVVMTDVITDPAFPMGSASSYWRRKREITFREAIEKLEEQLHRVSKPGAIVLFHEWNTPHYLDERENEKTRLQHLTEVFSNRWHIDTNAEFPRGSIWLEPYAGASQLIKLTKKRG